MARDYGVPDHMNLHQFRAAQRANKFRNYVRYLKDTGNTDELARIGGIFDSVDTSNFLFDHAKDRGFDPESLDLMHRHYTDPDTVHIGLSDDGPDYHLSGDAPRSESTFARSALQKKYRERLVKAEGSRAQIKGFDSPPSGPARDPDTLKTKSEGGNVTHSPYRYYSTYRKG